LYSELDYTIKKQIHRVELENCDLKDLILEQSEGYKELFSQVNFTYDLESSSVKIDTIGFIKVLDNLVQNAVKYSKPNSLIKISLKDFQLSIEDEGRGMEEEFLLNAFEHYYQEDEKSSGHGLGLGMVKEYCDTHKIKIYIDSKKDQGTTITLDLNKRNVNGIK
jgi:signal transduction histidine kinase